ncbi:MAG: hypothetical protein KJ767_03925 [Nanoarchaeota archaeon]|nr:hypothetical protein [Nanoarchaeota archaeon]
MSLNKVIENCKQIKENIDKRFEEMPKQSTCEHSALRTENKLYCFKLERCCVGAYCYRCPEYENHYLKIKK